MIKEEFGESIVFGDLVLVVGAKDEFTYGVVVGFNQVFIQSFNEGQPVYKVIGDTSLYTTRTIKLGQNNCYQPMIKFLLQKYQEINREVSLKDTKKLQVGDVFQSIHNEKDYVVYIGTDTDNREVFLDYSKQMINHGTREATIRGTVVMSMSTLVRTASKERDYTLEILCKTRIHYHHTSQYSSQMVGHVNIKENIKEFTIVSDRKELNIKLK